jgi:Tfp pilus assembly protein PilV
MRDEAGSALVEVMVSAIVVVLAAVGVFSALESASRSTAQERHRAQAHGLAQADLARMRTMRISDLSNLDETRQAVVDGTSYTIESVAAFQTDETGTASCEDGLASADYIQIRSEVTWPSIGSRAPVIAQSLVAPPNGSVSPDSGALAVQIEDAQNEGIEGVGLVGSHEKGEGSFSGPTGVNGCAVFGNLPDGNYTLEVTDSSLVDSDGNPPKPQVTSVVAESTNTLALQYDEPGTIEVGFETWIDGALGPTEFDSVVVFNTGMTVARIFGTPGVAGEAVEATTLFPFGSPYAVYAGTCEENNPNPGGEPEPPPAIADALVSPGGVTPVTLQLPPLDLTVWSGPSEAEKGMPIEGAEVVLDDTGCQVGEEGEEAPLRRTFTTNEAGGLDNPGLPFGEYDVCVAYGGKHISLAGVEVPADSGDLEAGTVREFFISNPAAETGSCP